MPEFDVNAARQSGASDDQILSYLTQRSPGFDAQGALQQASKTDVINYLATHSGHPVEPQAEIPSTTTGFEASGQMVPKSAVERGLKGQAIGTGAILGAGVAAPIAGEVGAVPAVVAAGRAAIRPVAKFATKHPIIANTIGSGLISQAREIPYVGKIIPPGAELIPWLRKVGGAEEGAAAPLETPPPAESAPAPAATPTRAEVATEVRKALGAPEPQAPAPGQPIYQRTGGTKALPQEIPPLTKVESSALKAYHYDPASKQLTLQTNQGALYQYGNVDSKLAETFRNADSKGKAWQLIRNDADAVLMRKNFGNGWINATPSAVTADPSAPEGEELTPLLKKSLERFKKAQGLANAAD